MLTRRLVVWPFSLAIMVLIVGGVFGQTTSTGSGQAYPNKPMRIVTGAIAGATGVASRLIAEGISGPLGQPVIVDNRASGNVQQGIVSRAAPDGYNLLVTGSSLWISPLTQPVEYDPVKDFAPISMIGNAPNILVVTPSLPVKSVKELIALAKARPEELNYSAGGPGGTSHLAMELFKAMAGVNIVHVAYASGSQSTQDLMSGRVHLEINSPASVMPLVKSGKLRALAVTGAEQSALAPDLPTLAASGLPGYEAVQKFGMFAPAKTPVAIINRLNHEIVRFLNQADVKEKLFNVGLETVSSSAEQLAATVKSDMDRWSKVIKDAGIRVK